MGSVINIRKANLNKMGYRDLEHWLENPNHIYIGRNMSFYVKGANESKWANPFSVKEFGREDCLKFYQEHIKESSLIDDLHELKRKVLGCWCHPEPCHGDVLIKMIKKL